MQMIESTRPVAANFFAASAISSEPGTRTISICFSSASSASASLEFCRPLFEEGAGALAHVFGGAADAEERCFEKQAFFERHVHAVLDRFHRVFHRERRVGDDFLCDGFGGGQKVGWLHDAIH